VGDIDHRRHVAGGYFDQTRFHAFSPLLGNPN
jgi:hypothetical protein